MNTLGSYISMPVARVDFDRNDEHQSKKEKEKQLERQLPRMRIAEQKRSEKMLATAMQIGDKKKSLQELPVPPKPATLKNKSDADNFLDHASALPRPVTTKNKSNADGVEQAKEIKWPELNDLHMLEELLHQRENPPSMSDMLTLLKNTEKTLNSEQELAVKAKRDTADRDDMLCSLDFLGGYVSASDEMPIIRAEIMEVIESLRQLVTNRPVDNRYNIALQQESLVQLVGDSETQYSVQKDALGHQKLVFEVSESMTKKIVSSPGRAEAKDAAANQNMKPGDDSLPLAVQRSV